MLSHALAAAHVVKIASDRLRGNETLLAAKSPLLLIETLGAAGLRYSHGSTDKKRVWNELSAFRVDYLRDAAGAGDWCSAGMIGALGMLGPDGLADASTIEVRTALRRGQAMAAWTCRYDGARGGMYASSKKAFDQAIEDILTGKGQPRAKAVDERRSRIVAAGAWCDCCLPAI